MERWVIGEHTPEEVVEYLNDKAVSLHEPIYCFDYFDTLVVRSVYPEQTKQLAANLLSQFLDFAVPADTLYEVRRDLEKELCATNAAGGGELEFYLPEFGPHYLERLRLRDAAALQQWESQRFTQLLLDLELTVELSVQSRCTEVVAVLQSLKSKGQKTVLISDFYLPSSHFSQLLDAFELTPLLDHVYISADHKLAKGSGRLYEKIATDLNCRPEQMVMIGDNPHADVAMARERGINAVHLHNPQQREFYTLRQREQVPGIAEITEKFDRVMGQIDCPFREMASSLWFFIGQLFGELIRRGTEDVFFFSKEGEFLKRLFDQFQGDVFGRPIIRSHYILVSRKATFLASLRPLEQEDFARLFHHYRDIALRDFLLSLNLEESTAQALCADLELDYEQRVADLGNSPQFTALIQAESFQELYESRRQQQQRNFIAYLDSFGVNYQDQGLTIVDVGWKGSIQDNVYHILGGEVELQGYFAGSLIATEKLEKNQKKGLLFDDAPAPTPFFQVYNNNRSLYEMVLGASHGSADGYFRASEYGQLAADHQRCVHTRLPDGEEALLVTTLDFPEERELFNAVMRPVQEELHKACIAFTAAYRQSGYKTPGAEWFARQHARMVFKPTQGEVDFFERLYHLENFGVFEYTDFKAGQGLSIKQRLRNLRDVTRDGALLESGIWPPIILNRMGIGFYRHLDGRRRYKREFGR
ncbi:HAD family hydrolase [Desulfogranum mediterraneum]|uniref:HAD family hydrolase n=1 Tax=Desulfogranum mediterraneum TaxID=160661 RepID=UPI000417B0E9|nr:HAD family hydrolase [Desulfogranum mediterraneum]